MLPNRKPFVVPVFIPHAGCPQRCVFCNQHSTTGQGELFPSISSVRSAIEGFLQHRRDKRRWTEISFFGGNFLGMAPEQVQLLLATAARYVRQGRADGIRFSTRPDTIDAQRLALLEPFPVTTVEVGVQSMNDAVLALCRRGHDAQSTRQGLSLLRAFPYRVGAQIMVGLPGDTPASALASARQLADLAPDFVRIYPTLVLKGSSLARWHALGRYEPLSLESAVTLVADLYQVFARHDIPVVRMGLQATAELSPQSELLAGPFHPAFGELVHSALWREAISRHLGREGLAGAAVILHAHPRRISQLKGRHDEYILELLNQHALKSIEVRADEMLPEDVVMINGKACRR